MKINTKKKIVRTKEEQKVYNEAMAEKRKTNEYFVEATTKRTNAVIKSMKRLGFMARYNGTDEQKQKVIDAIKKECGVLENTFMNRKTEGFKL